MDPESKGRESARWPIPMLRAEHLFDVAAVNVANVPWEEPDQEADDPF